MTVARRRQLSTDEYADGVRRGDVSLLGRAITLVESSAPRHRDQARDLMPLLMPYTGKAARIGISGVPGAGKSTFIDAFGTFLTAHGKKVAVLAVDPSSSVSGGSILGDKTRMARLACDPRAFIRPSPSAGTLGGVARKTRESMLLCEAAGFDVVLVETVGVGQSETVVADMTDFFLVLMIAGAGDSLQGIKRGVLEVADMLAINKADGDNRLKAQQAAAEYRGALELLHSGPSPWKPPVLTCSALENAGLEEIWKAISEHHTVLQEAELFERKRQGQALRWMWDLVDESLRRVLREHAGVRETLGQVESEVLAGRLPSTVAAEAILEAFGFAGGNPGKAEFPGPSKPDGIG